MEGGGEVDFGIPERSYGKAATPMLLGLPLLSDRRTLMEESFGKREELHVLGNVWLVMFEMSMPATPCGLRQSLD